MTVADLRFASQLVAPQEEPRFFDDLGCLRTYLETATAAPGTVAYVADYRTKAWVPATRAVLVRQPAINTPMGSGIIAFADEASRAAEPAAAGGTLIGLDEVFGPKGPPGGSR
jgi:copper chaperone NosL